MNELINFDLKAFIASIIGMIVYFLVVFELKRRGAKDKSFKKFWSDEWVQVLIAFFLCVIMASYIDAIIDGLSDDLGRQIVWPLYYYLLGGIWLNLIIQLFANINKLISYLFKKFKT